MDGFEDDVLFFVAHRLDHLLLWAAFSNWRLFGERSLDILLCSLGLERKIFLDDGPIDPPALALKVDVAQWFPANNVNVDEDVLTCECNHDKTNLVARSCIWNELCEAEEAVR